MIDLIREYGGDVSGAIEDRETAAYRRGFVDGYEDGYDDGCMDMLDDDLGEEEP